jgi:glycosyltransferase involved in cell wall biosynthesis
MISVIIPTLNEESVIEKTLTLLKSELTLPHEIIVSDGKSTDKTVAIARGLADIVVAYNEPARQTIAQGRNAGARASHGDILAFMDADCSFSDPNDFFARALKHFENNPKLVALTVSVRVIPKLETFSDKLVFISLNNYFRILNNLLKLNIAAGEFQMIRRSAFVKMGGYNEKFVASEDIDMFHRLSKIGQIFFDHRLTVFHTGRRAHKIGWPRLLSHWFLNSVSIFIRRKAYSKEWEVIR